MNTARRITTNFLSLVFSDFASRIIQLLIFVYLARHFGRENFGIFSFGLAFALLAAILTDFGLSTLLVRDTSRNKKDASKYISNALLLKIFLALITVALSYAFLNSMGYKGETKAVAYIMLSFAILQSFTELYCSIFRSFERMHYDASIKVLRMLILSAAVFYSLKNNFSLVISSFSFPITESIILLTAILLVYTRFIKISFSFDFALLRHLLKESSFFCLSMAFAGLFLYIDQIMLSKLGSASDVGIYAAASNIAIALISIPMMYANSIYPVISRLYVSSKESLKFVYERSFKYMLIIGLAISAGIYALSDKIIAFLYGKEYIASSIVLAIVCWHLFLRFANVMSGFTLSSMDRQGSRVISQGIASLSKIALNFILIPFYGIVGAAIATLVTEILFFVIYTFFVSKYGIKISVLKQFLKPAIAALVMIAALNFIGNLFIAVALGAVIYSATLVLLNTIDSEDRKLVYKVIKNI